MEGDAGQLDWHSKCFHVKEITREQRRGSTTRWSFIHSGDYISLRLDAKVSHCFREPKSSSFLNKVPTFNFIKSGFLLTATAAFGLPAEFLRTWKSSTLKLRVLSPCSDADEHIGLIKSSVSCPRTFWHANWKSCRSNRCLLIYWWPRVAHLLAEHCFHNDAFISVNGDFSCI